MDDGGREQIQDMSERGKEGIYFKEKIKKGEWILVNKKQRINSASFSPLLLLPYAMCSCLSSVDPLYQTVYHYELNALGEAFILQLSFKPPDNKHSVISPSPAVGVYLSAA